MALTEARLKLEQLGRSLLQGHPETTFDAFMRSLRTTNDQHRLGVSPEDELSVLDKLWREHCQTGWRRVNSPNGRSEAPRWHQHRAGSQWTCARS